jgi:hypothetical protein
MPLSVLRSVRFKSFFYPNLDTILKKKYQHKSLLHGVVERVALNTQQTKLVGRFAAVKTRRLPWNSGLAKSRADGAYIFGSDMSVSNIGYGWTTSHIDQTHLNDKYRTRDHFEVAEKTNIRMPTVGFRPQMHSLAKHRPFRGLSRFNEYPYNFIFQDDTEVFFNASRIPYSFFINEESDPSFFETSRLKRPTYTTRHKLRAQCALSLCRVV